MSVLLLLVLFPLVSAPAFAESNLETLAIKSTSADAAESASAIAELRSMGPSGLNALRQIYAAEIDYQVSHPLAPETAEWRRLKTALDAVSQQKDSYLGGLYWYTDFNEAKAAARATGKPILSLRLLGKLSEEFSCANSRFFRTVLYSNAEVSKRLRDHFILHWQSERPAPRVTIDFGDGRKLERTLTGNSIHYILDTDGKTLDALPGLYGPAAFLRQLTGTEEMFRQSRNRETGNVSAYQRDRLNKINLDWLADIERIGGKVPAGLVVMRRQDGTPEALQITSLAITKMITEASILRSMTAGAEALGTVTDEAAWKKMALLHLADAELDARSIGLIRRQTHRILQAEGSKTKPDEALSSILKLLQMNIAMDAVRNEYLLHTKLYAWLIADRSRSDLETLNKKVYAELFLTPASDPWLGLFSAETYVALENGGLKR